MTNIYNEIQDIRKRAGMGNLLEEETFSMSAHEDLISLLQGEKKFLYNLSKFTKDSGMTDRQFIKFMSIVKSRVNELEKISQGYKPSGSASGDDNLDSLKRVRGDISMYQQNTTTSNRKPKIDTKV